MQKQKNGKSLVNAFLRMQYAFTTSIPLENSYTKLRLYIQINSFYFILIEHYLRCKFSLFCVGVFNVKVH